MNLGGSRDAVPCRAVAERERSLWHRILLSDRAEAGVLVAAAMVAAVAGNLIADRLKSVPFWIVLPLFVIGSLLATHSCVVLIRSSFLHKQVIGTSGGNTPHVSIAAPLNFPEHLYGRQEIIDDLCAAKPGQIVLVSGMGGVGKTAVAAAVAERYKARGRRSYWVDCRDPSVIAASMIEVARAVGMPLGDAGRSGANGGSPSPDAVWRYLDEHANGRGCWFSTMRTRRACWLRPVVRSRNSKVGCAGLKMGSWL